MELWDIYDADKKPTGRTMKRNDWCLKAAGKTAEKGTEKTGHNAGKPCSR